MATVRGGEKAAAYLKTLAKRLGKPVLRVGFLEGSTYPDGTSVPLVAAIGNFGAPKAGIPARPFFSNMIATKAASWPKALAMNLKATGYDGPRALELVGEGIKGQLAQSIVDTNSPPLAEATILARGVSAAGNRSEKPLVDSGHMLASIDSEVKS